MSMIVNILEKWLLESSGEYSGLVEFFWFGLASLIQVNQAGEVQS
jgi:hypothetical protein